MSKQNQVSEETATGVKGDGEPPVGTSAEAERADTEAAREPAEPEAAPTGPEEGPRAEPPEEAAPDEEAAAGGQGEAEAPEGVEEAGGERVEELARRLQEAERKAEAHWNQVLRVRAELENMQKRAARELESAHKFALERFVSELLPVKDSMELGLSAAEGERADLAKVREGLELTLKMFGNVMEKFGIEAIDPARGEAFNPEYHEAMSTQAVEDVESGHVVMVVQKGYLLNERLVRPAMVIVAQ